MYRTPNLHVSELAGSRVGPSFGDLLPGGRQPGAAAPPVRSPHNPAGIPGRSAGFRRHFHRTLTVLEPAVRPHGADKRSANVKHANPLVDGQLR